MSTYNPDRWVVVELTYKDEEGNPDTIKKVLAGWGGSYLYGSSWKLSSGVTNQREFDDRFEFENHSGSLYVCRKNSYGLSGYTAQILEGFMKQAEESEGKVSIKVLEEYDVCV